MYSYSDWQCRDCGDLCSPESDTCSCSKKKKKKDSKMDFEIKKSDWIGLDEKEAESRAIRLGLFTRITKRNGEYLNGTCDHQLQRINFELSEDGKIEEVSMG